MAGKGSKARSGKGSGGRTTPKGGAQRAPSKDAKHDPGDFSSGRYTPPTDQHLGESPAWVPIVMFGLLGLGMLLIIVNYSGALPFTPNNWMLLPALVCFSGGLLAAMNYR